jgi:uncharacterized lipoprotein YddW (UPF0748 family)
MLKSTNVLSPIRAALLSLTLLAGCQAPPAAPLSGGPAPTRIEPSAAGPRPMPRAVRAMWVARFHYETPDDIAAIMRNCAEMGMNTVLWQVRGNGTVKYRSQLEVWDETYGFRDPGFDPLTIAVEEAHRNGLRIEAWINVMPGWKGPREPADKRQLYWSRPEWFLHDAVGQRQPLGDFYVILNPCLPEVRNHIAGIAQEICANYRVDGIHLDYVRYAWETTPNARESFPRDAQTLRRYQLATGQTPDADPRAWDSWRINQLTELVAQIKETVARTRPGATLTAATWGNPNNGLANYFQNVIGWLRSGLLDASYPMTYTDNAAKLQEWIDIYRQGAPNARIIPGLGAYKCSQPPQFASQLDLCNRWGGDFALFSYGSLRAVAGDRKAGQAALRKENEGRQMRREVLQQFVPARQPQ